MKILLDTTVLVDALRARNKRRELLAQLVRQGHELCTTALNVAEVHGGMRPHERSATETFLDAFPSFAIDLVIARSAGDFKSQWARQGRTLGIVDCAIAAAAVEHGCLLATDNRRDFPMPEIKLYPVP